MVPGLSRAHYEYLLALSALVEASAEPTVVRHCELRGWVRGGRLTDDGRFVLERAAESPPPAYLRHFARSYGIF